jgi:hypothetical protein
VSEALWTSNIAPLASNVNIKLEKFINRQYFQDIISRSLDSQEKTSNKCFDNIDNIFLNKYKKIKILKIHIYVFYL